MLVRMIQKTAGHSHLLAVRPASPSSRCCVFSSFSAVVSPQEEVRSRGKALPCVWFPAEPGARDILEGRVQRAWGRLGRHRSKGFGLYCKDSPSRCLSDVPSGETEAQEDEGLTQGSTAHSWGWNLKSADLQTPVLSTSLFLRYHQVHFSAG